MKNRQKVLTLKPTQFAVGMLEVDEKILIVKKYGKKQRREFVDEHPVPVVVSPWGPLRRGPPSLSGGLLPLRDQEGADHGHQGLKSKMSYAQFWKWMSKSRNSYPYCQFGEGPRLALYLPRDIPPPADDPYRSLAWFVRKAGGFEGSERNYAESKWAGFFRARRLLDRSGPRGLAQALPKAVLLAKPAAKRFPDSAS